MATKLICDLCDRDCNGLKEFGELDEAFRIGDRVRYTCHKCTKKVNKKLHALLHYYNGEIAKDMREWLLHEFNRKQPQNIEET